MTSRAVVIKTERAQFVLRSQVSKERHWVLVSGEDVVDTARCGDICRIVKCFRVVPVDLALVEGQDHSTD